MKPEAPHILVVDDEERLRNLLRRFLNEQGYMVTTAANAADARSRLSSLEFDLLIVDVMMPGEDGIDFTTSLRNQDTIPILLLTARGEPEDRIRGLEAGADDYLAKPFEPRELLLRVNNILRRVERAPVQLSGAVRMGDFEFDLERQELHGTDGPVRLTGSEATLLKTLAIHAGSILSRQELARRSKMTGNERTVDVQVTRLRRKLEKDPKEPRYLQTVWGEGYVLRPDSI
ncbi:MAG: response regulator [Pseudomonadota bacterium]